MTITLTAASAVARRAQSSNSSGIGGTIVFSRSGRFRVMVATGPSVAYTRVSWFMGESFHPDQGAAGTLAFARHLSAVNRHSPRTAAPDTGPRAAHPARPRPCADRSELDRWVVVLGPELSHLCAPVRVVLVGGALEGVGQ